MPKDWLPEEPEVLCYSPGDIVTKFANIIRTLLRPKMPDRGVNVSLSLWWTEKTDEPALRFYRLLSPFFANCTSRKRPTIQGEANRQAIVDSATSNAYVEDYLLLFSVEGATKERAVDLWKPI